MNEEAQAREKLEELEATMPPLSPSLRRSHRLRKTVSALKMPQTSMERPTDIEEEERKKKGKAVAKGKCKLEEAFSPPHSTKTTKRIAPSSLRGRKILNPVLFDEKKCLANELFVLVQWLGVQGWNECPIWTNPYQVNRKEVLEFYSTLDVFEDGMSAMVTVKG